MRKNDEWQSRRSMAEYGRKLLELGLVQGTWGEHICETFRKLHACNSKFPGLDYKMIDGSDMVKVAIKNFDMRRRKCSNNREGLTCRNL